VVFVWATWVLNSSSNLLWPPALCPGGNLATPSNELSDFGSHLNFHGLSIKWGLWDKWADINCIISPNSVQRNKASTYHISLKFCEANFLGGSAELELPSLLSPKGWESKTVVTHGNTTILSCSSLQSASHSINGHLYFISAHLETGPFLVLRIQYTKNAD
jgi:hypothetical protein